MKHIKQFFIAFLCLFMSITLVAQQGNVAAGGDNAGSGGSISFSIGQSDYLIYTADQSSLSLGLQQPFFYGVPLELQIPETIISDGEALCFNAEETVIVAGDGKHFTIQDGGSAEVIAGSNIVIKDGTTIEHGGMFHAYISTIWCIQPSNFLASSVAEVIPEQLPSESESLGTYFKVYPNPTTGIFTLELLDFEDFSKIRVEIFSALGHLVFAGQLPARKINDFSISDKQPGIYLIRVHNDQEIGTIKIMKQ